MTGGKLTQTLLAATLVAATGCATLGETVVKTDQVLLKTGDRQDRKKTFLVTAKRGDDQVVRVVAVDACERRTVYDKDEVKHVEKLNESIGGDVTWGILGGLAAGGGAVLVVDSANVADNDPTQRAFNAVGPTAALGLGIGTIALGAGLLTIPLVDGIRASRSRDDHRPYKEDGAVTVAAETCGANGAPEGSVEVGAEDVLPKLDLSFEGETEAWRWRGVAGDGTKKFSVELVQVLPDAVLRASKRAGRVKLGMGGIEVANYETAALFAVADDRAWAKLAESRKRCQAPDSLDDCNDVEHYGRDYPSSKHAPVARTLVAGAQPTLTSLREDQAYAYSEADDCKAATTETACDALSSYLNDWPNGRHAKEALGVLAVGKPRVTRLIAKREAEERAEAARQRAEEARAEAQRRMEEAQEAARQRAEEARERAAEAASYGRCHYWRNVGRGLIQGTMCCSYKFFTMAVDEGVCSCSQAPSYCK